MSAHRCAATWHARHSGTPACACVPPAAMGSGWCASTVSRDPQRAHRPPVRASVRRAATRPTARAETPFDAIVLRLRWDDVDLPGGSVRVRGTKTSASDRWAEMLPALRDDRDDLLPLKARRDPRPQDLVVPTARGTAQGKDNARERWWKAAVREANVHLAEAGPRGFRSRATGRLRCTRPGGRSSASSWPSAWDLGRVMDNIWHTSVATTYETYRRQLNRRDGASRRATAGSRSAARQRRSWSRRP